MAQVTVLINGYSYTVGCEDGQEQHLQTMAAEVDKRIDSIKALGGQNGEARLLMLAALLLADELHDLTSTPKTRLPRSEASSLARDVEPVVRGKLADLASRAETIASKLEDA